MEFFFKLLVLFFYGVVWAQNVEIVSHYPETAYITERLLPFSVVNGGADQEVRIQTVHLIKGESCRSIVDPFYGKIFHIYCETPTQVKVEVSIVNAHQGTSKISMDEFHIRAKNEQQAFERGDGG